MVMGLFGRAVVLAALGALPIAAAGLYLGGRVHTGLSRRAFVAFISALPVGAGVALLLES